jgi:hypothetical protein
MGKKKKPVNSDVYGPLSLFVILFVGKTGFEPATPWSQTRCATGLRYFPIRHEACPYRKNDGPVGPFPGMEVRR